jgi:hypothetical protein
VTRQCLLLPILLQNDFAHLGAQDRFNTRRQCAMLIQKSTLLDSIVSNFYSTVSPRRLLQQNLHIAAVAVASAMSAAGESGRCVRGNP